ncbi:hypothetical protein V9T40_000089 [Parthenolecanium corni]|uniref:Uncharacterized protein n=1 Tax=Parthenolecanium corni TaxID=536013 RepID=A0AAN9TI47_9HEMI
MAVIDVIKAEYSAYTALDEKIEDGDKVLLMACVFASPTQNELADASNETHNYPPTLESFEDQTDAMAIFTPCQVYYPHPYFSDMVPCPGDIPDHWTGSTLLEESNYSEILIHFSDRAKLSFALKSSRTNTAEQLTTSPSPALFGEPLEALLIPRTTKSSIFEQLDSSDENSLSDAFYIKWQSESERMRRADRKNKNNFLLFDPVDPDSDEFDSNFNEFDPLPDKPEKETIYLMPTPATVTRILDAAWAIVLLVFILFSAISLNISTADLNAASAVCLGVDIGAVSDEGKIPGVTADEDPISKDLADPAGVILDTSSFNSLSFFIGVCCL